MAETGDGLTRLTVNATRRTSGGIDALMDTSGDNKTDAINGALRLAATLLAYTRPDSTMRVLAPAGATRIVHLP